MNEEGVGRRAAINFNDHLSVRQKGFLCHRKDLNSSWRERKKPVEESPKLMFCGLPRIFFLAPKAVKKASTQNTFENIIAGLWRCERWREKRFSIGDKRQPVNYSVHCKSGRHRYLNDLALSKMVPFRDKSHKSIAFGVQSDIIVMQILLWRVPDWKPTRADHYPLTLIRDLKRDPFKHSSQDWLSCQLTSALNTKKTGKIFIIWLD